MGLKGCRLWGMGQLDLTCAAPHRVAARGAQVVQRLLVVLVRAVGEVEARDVHARGKGWHSRYFASFLVNTRTRLNRR
jgi:hypothetical protein